MSSLYVVQCGCGVQSQGESRSKAWLAYRTHFVPWSAEEHKVLYDKTGTPNVLKARERGKA